MRRAWVTGFEPFFGVPSNPSADILAEIPRQIEDTIVETTVLPVDTEAVEMPLSAIYETRPDIVIHVGVAETRDVVSVERVAVNQRRFRVPDNANRVITDQPVIANAPDTLASRLPVQDIHDALIRQSIPVEMSDSAGAFLCNQVMFTSLHRLDGHVKTGFLHVPLRMSLERIAEAVCVALRITILAMVCVVALGADALAKTPIPFMKGMTVSCPGYGQIWGAPEMTDSLEVLAKHGVEWVAIHPYASVRTNGEIRWQPASQTGYLPRSITICKQQKMHVFWKPHLAYWGSFDWRGSIDFGEDQAAWARFFRGYREFIVDQARFAESAKAPLFSVGIEYAKTTRFEKEWRSIIADIRRVYHGKITYSANWDDFDRVTFWDALDLIGVQAYFPLGNKTPTRAELLASWDRHLAKIEALSKKHKDMPVVFTEIGYSRSRNAAAEPWKPEVDDSAEARALRTMLMEVAYTRIGKEPLVRGMFWWKWLPGRSPFQQDFSMKDPEALETMQRYWR